ncbi:MAG: tryptophan synthase subunit beta, partial [Patescibacteria group bacterium]|nr:tryptophan synthase subunit beta [Patescibacteria group bacterium]
MKSHFGKYGGSYVPEMLIPVLRELSNEYEKANRDPEFKKEFLDLLYNFNGRPTPLVFAKNLT